VSGHPDRGNARRSEAQAIDCATVNLHERMLIVEGDDVVDAWATDARGWEAKA